MGKFMKKHLGIALGAFLDGAAISLFLDPNNLAPGGVAGISVILNRLTGLPTGAGILILNIPLLAAGGWRFGWNFLLSTMYATGLCSLFTGIFSVIGAVTTDPFLAALFGGGLMAVGLAIVFRSGATTGGTDIVIKFLRLKYRHLKTGRLFLLIDLCIVFLSFFVFDSLNTVLYAALAVIVNSTVFDLVLYGPDEAKMAFVISIRSAQITDRILNDLGAGVTHLRGKGAYSSVEKDVILCVVRKYLMPKLEEIIREVDPEAFLIIGRANEIYGSGYKNIFGEKY